VESGSEAFKFKERLHVYIGGERGTEKKENYGGN